MLARELGMGFGRRSKVLDLKTEGLKVNAGHVAANTSDGAEEFGIDDMDLFDGVHSKDESPVHLGHHADVGIQIVELKEGRLEIGLSAAIARPSATPLSESSPPK